MFNIVEYLSEDHIVEPVNKDNVSITCPWCGKGGKHFTIHITDPICNCYKCHKHSSWAGLIAELEQITYFQALAKIENECSFEVIKKEEKKELIKIPLPELSNFSDDALLFLNKRKITQYTIQRFQISYTRKGWHKDRLIFPITLNGEAITFQSRKVYEEDQKKRYLTPMNSPLGSLLYGYDQMKEGETEVVVVEGVFDVLNMYQNGINVVGSFGKKISDEQIQLLKKKNIQKIILMWDSDALKELEPNWDNVNRNIKTYICPLNQGDPGELDNPKDYMLNNTLENINELDKWKINRFRKCLRDTI